MEVFDVEVLKGERTIAAHRSVAFRTRRDSWPWLFALAEKVEEPGCQIRVTDANQEIVIFTGVATVRCMASELPGLYRQ